MTRPGLFGLLLRGAVVVGVVAVLAMVVVGVVQLATACTCS